MEASLAPGFLSVLSSADALIVSPARLTATLFLMSGFTPISDSSLGMNRISVLISNESIVRILAISVAEVHPLEELAGLLGDDAGKNSSLVVCALVQRG